MVERLVAAENRFRFAGRTGGEHDVGAVCRVGPRLEVLRLRCTRGLIRIPYEDRSGTALCISALQLGEKRGLPLRVG